MSDRVVVELEIAAPADTVWRALREPAEIRRWFGWDYDGLEEEIRFIFVQEAKADDDARTLDGGPGGTIALEDRGDRTLVRVTRPASEDGYDEVDEGWISFIQQLRFYLERHPGRERRTEHVPLSGDEWFSSANQRGAIRADGALVIRTPTRVIVSRYE
jgi:uncharacterized protein YndB with AHSA1/START domain